MLIPVLLILSSSAFAGQARTTLPLGPTSGEILATNTTHKGTMRAALTLLSGTCPAASVRINILYDKVNTDLVVKLGPQVESVGIPVKADEPVVWSITSSDLGDCSLQLDMAM